MKAKKKMSPRQGAKKSSLPLDQNWSFQEKKKSSPREGGEKKFPPPLGGEKIPSLPQLSTPHPGNLMVRP